jgi:hypothetical protein
MADHNECEHERILTWSDEATGMPVGLWSCAKCSRKFVPMEVGANASEAPGWVRLADSDWVNIVNHPDVLDRPDADTELAVACAVRLTEARLRELNASGAKEPR